VGQPWKYRLEKHAYKFEVFLLSELISNSGPTLIASFDHSQYFDGIGI
jgi:hypothetical protein